MTEKISMMKNWRKISWKQKRWISGTAHFWSILSFKEISKSKIFFNFYFPENNFEAVQSGPLNFLILTVSRNKFNPEDQIWKKESLLRDSLLEMNEDFDFAIFKNFALPPPVSFQSSIKSGHKREKTPILKRNWPNDDGFSELLEEIKANLRATRTRRGRGEN